jgi:hypothetical protein
MPEERNLALLSDLLVTAQRDFDANVKHSASMDDKAQKLSGLSGIFLAVAFGFVRPESLIELRKHFGNPSLLLLGLSLALLVACIVVCLLAMWHREVPLSGISLGAHEDAVNIVREFPSGTIDDELTEFYRQNQIDIWRAATDECRAVNKSKDRFVLWAQILLGLGIVVAVFNIGVMAVQVWRGKM